MNHLSNQTSPYLIQHVNNPVDWYPWGPEAFEKAARLDRPVLISIGYSTCHWCHVMAHESFEDPVVGDQINQNFVAIKVDREERPDVDAIYMDALVAISGSGGWPLTAFLFPDGRPFFAGTYFPPRPTRHLPSFSSLLDSISAAWRDKRDQLSSQADLIVETIREANTGRDREKLSGSLDLAQDADKSFEQMANDFTQIEAGLKDWVFQKWDSAWGGFGSAPKFPQCGVIEFLERQVLCGKADDLGLAMVESTLAAMAAGGIYDHLGGGFARYSTDNTWLVPHFEKMLYDQSLIAKAYVQAFQLTLDPRWRQVAVETVDYVLRDLALDGGGYGCGQDADSEGHEGKYYLWSLLEMKEILDEESCNALADWYGVTWKGNFENNTNILRRPLGESVLKPPLVEEASKRLLAARYLRVPPGLDNKVLCEWNAMFASTLCVVASAVGENRYREAASGLGEFLWDNLLDQGRWKRAFHHGRGAYNDATSADLGWLINAFTRLYELTGRSKWIDRAQGVFQELSTYYHDDEQGGYFSTPHDADELIFRRKDLSDSSVPAGNSVLCESLFRLGSLMGSRDLVARSYECAGLVLDKVVAIPQAFSFMVCAVDTLVNPSSEILIDGDSRELLEVVHRHYLPYSVVAHREPIDSPIWQVSKTLRSDQGSESPQKVRAYVCSNFSCSSPTSDIEELEDILVGLPIYLQRQGP